MMDQETERETRGRHGEFIRKVKMWKREVQVKPVDLCGVFEGRRRQA